MNRTGIVYLDFTWNPTSGCTYGCPECWARKLHTRFYTDFEPRFYPDRLCQPAKRKKTATIGVSFMGDLFDPAFDAEPGMRHVAEEVFRVCDAATQHDYVFLTKRAERMAGRLFNEGPRPNWYMGVTARNQTELDRTAPHINSLAERGWKVWLSLEPCLDEVNIQGLPVVGVVMGGKSGAATDICRPAPYMAERVRDDCKKAGIPFALKQWSGPRPEQWPTLDGKQHKALAWPLHSK